jgi:esterase/lipase superfamily enzyme
VKTVERWHSDRLEQEFTVARWGHYGAPVLVFPTAGGDAEEIERHKLVEACGELLEAGRIKIYSCDSVAGRAMAASTGSPEYRMWLLNQFHQAVRHEVVPAIHADTGGSDQRIVAAGASIGAFNAVALLCRFPDVFDAAIGMSGTYRIQRFLDGAWSDDLFYSSPLDFLPGLGGDHLELLRQRRVILPSGEGEHEDIGESWAMAEVLGSKGVPNRVDSWGPETIHDWPTWWRMLPQYLDELC